MAAPSPAEVGSVNSALMAAFPTAIGGGAIEIDTPLGRTAESGRARTPPASPAIVGAADTPPIALTPSAPAGSTSANTAISTGDNVAGWPPPGIDPTTAAPADLGLNANAGGSASTADEPLPALGSVPAPPGLLVEAQFAVLPVALAPAGEVTRDERVRLQPSGGVSDAWPTAAGSAPVAGADTSPTRPTTSPAPAPDPSLQAVSPLRSRRILCDWCRAGRGIW